MKYMPTLDRKITNEEVEEVIRAWSDYAIAKKQNAKTEEEKLYPKWDKFSKIKKYLCPCCNFPHFMDDPHYAICIVCGWEDDGQTDHDADKVLGGPNGDLSLTKARENFKTHWTCCGVDLSMSDEFSVGYNDNFDQNIYGKRGQDYRRGIFILGIILNENDPQRCDELLSVAEMSLDLECYKIRARKNVEYQ